MVGPPAALQQRIGRKNVCTRIFGRLDWGGCHKSLEAALIQAMPRSINMGALCWHLGSHGLCVISLSGANKYNSTSWGKCPNACGRPLQCHWPLALQWFPEVIGALVLCVKLDCWAADLLSTRGIPNPDTPRHLELLQDHATTLVRPKLMKSNVLDDSAETQNCIESFKYLN